MPGRSASRNSQNDPFSKRPSPELFEQGCELLKKRAEQGLDAYEEPSIFMAAHKKR
jgi:hypothetical protein